MNITDTHYFGYRSALAQNRDLFLLKFPGALFDFLTLDSYFDPLAELTKKPNKNGKNSIGFVPFINLMRRQTVNAFEALATMQSYQAWVVFRPSIEAALIMGKWMDDPLYATYWKERDKYPKEYREHFWGDGIVSQHLPRSQDIRSVLKRVNDEFMHLNWNYVSRSTIIRDIDADNFEIAAKYIDPDAEHAAHLYAFLHLALILIHSSISMLNADVAQPVTIDVKVKDFEQAYASLVSKLCQDHPDKRKILTEFGLWELA